MEKINWKKEDMIIYYYMSEEILKGRIVEVKKYTAIIEVGIPKRGTSGIYRDKLEVELCKLYPISMINEIKADLKLPKKKRKICI